VINWRVTVPRSEPEIGANCATIRGPHPAGSERQKDKFAAPAKAETNATKAPEGGACTRRSVGKSAKIDCETEHSKFDSTQVDNISKRRQLLKGKTAEKRWQR
jgi:hypothetical protein